MALKNNWTPKVNEVDDVDADDINSIADAVIENETDIGKLQQNSEKVNENIQSLTEIVNTNADDIEDLKEIVEELQESGGGGTSGEITQDVTSAILLAMYNEVDVRPSPENWFVFDENTGAISEFNYEKESDILSAEEIVFPWSINGIPVKIIGSGSALSFGLSDVLSAKSIRFPNSIIEIKSYAFETEHNLESINIPTSLMKIEGGAFKDCASLHEIITPIKPNWELKIEQAAFNNCSSLNNIDSIIDGIKEISESAFYLCTSLKSVTLPESVNTIGKSAFLLCSNLKIINVLNPNTVLTEGFCNSDVIIKGYSNSTAEAYALTYGNPFIGIDAIYYDGSEVAL